MKRKNAKSIAPKDSKISPAPISQVFLQALKSLPATDRDQVILALARDKELGEDILDLALANSRESEHSRSLRDFLKEADSLKNT